MEAKTDTALATPADALGSVATQHILERLEEAAELARQDLQQNVEKVRDLLADAAAQSEAWLLARDVEGETPAEQPVSQLARRMLFKPDAQPVDAFLLIPFGEVKVERPMSGGTFVFTRTHAESVRRWFEQIGRKLAIDYEHQSFERYNHRADGLRPAAGWIGRLEVRDDGLWACDVTWTARARELLSSGEYRYFSPVVYWTDEDYSDVAALGPVALTNDPAMRGVQPLAAARCLPNNMLTGDDQVAESRRAEASESAEPQITSVLRSEIDALNHEVEMLHRQLAAQEADAFVERGMRLGKIVDSTSLDWREDYLRDPERTQARLERAPVLLPPGRVVQVAARSAPLFGDKSSVSKRSAGGRADGAVEAEDLAVYERALAAGRIVQFGTLQRT